MTEQLEALDFAVSLVTKVEALGYHKISAFEKQKLQVFMKNTPILLISDDIADRAIALMQDKKSELGDALIAATALENNLELWTNNSKDFSWIENLKWHNPIR